MHRFALTVVSIPFLLTTARAQQSVVLDGPFEPSLGSAYDSSRDRLVVFGIDGRTRELADDRWLSRMAQGDGGAMPPARQEAAMAFDSARKHVLLFGGYDGSTFGDTWTYDGVRWTQLTGTAPPRRSGAGATFDSVRNRVVMCGGQERFVGGFSDTWEHDGTNWIQRSPSTVPPGGNAPPLAFDSARAVTVMLAASGLFGAPMATWEWNGTNWTQRAISGPAPLGATALAFDPSRGRCVALGGGTQTVGTTTISPGSQIWEWNGTAWTQVQTLAIPLRRDCTAWFDAGRGKVVVAGGPEAVGADNGDATMTWDGTSLLPLHPFARPRNRFSHAWIADVQGAVMFGGSTGTADTWQWDGAAWHQVALATAPPARSNAATMYDLVLQRSLMFGGVTAGQFVGDLWIWNGQQWSSGPGGPPARAGAGFAQDLLRNENVLFGGFSTPLFQPGSVRNDTWVLNGTTWSQRSPTLSPPPREGAAMTADLSRNVVMLFGGRTGPTLADQLADTWEWNGTTWTPRPTATTPPPLVQPSLVFDFARSRVVLAGTRLIPPTPYHAEDQEWEFTGADWQLLASEALVMNGGIRVPSLAQGGAVLFDGKVVRAWTGAPAQWNTFGSGCGARPPRLTMRSRPHIGEPDSGLELLADPSLPCAFAAAGQSGSIPLGGGCTLLLGGSNPVLFFGATDARGTSTLPWSPPALLRGATLFAQGAVLDPTTPLGFAVTAGVQLTVGV